MKQNGATLLTAERTLRGGSVQVACAQRFVVTVTAPLWGLPPRTWQRPQQGDLLGSGKTKLWRGGLTGGGRRGGPGRGRGRGGEPGLLPTPVFAALLSCPAALQEVKESMLRSISFFSVVGSV